MTSGENFSVHSAANILRMFIAIRKVKRSLLCFLEWHVLFLKVLAARNVKNGSCYGSPLQLLMVIEISTSLPIIYSPH